MPSCHVTWLTDFPELLPSVVDVAVKFSDRSVAWISGREFDLALILDKDPEAIGVGESVLARKKMGFGLDAYGRCRPLNAWANPKFVTGVFDDVSRTNRRSYVQEIFEISGYEFDGEQYWLDVDESKVFQIGGQSPVVGLNTGCGLRWPSRQWPEEYWESLCLSVAAGGAEVLLLGGEQEDSLNKRLAARTGAKYLGCFPIEDFVALVGNCDVVVTQVTMALHVAIGLRKRLVLMNNIFNPHEFELYGLGEIIEPAPPCECYYASECPHDSMRRISPEAVLEAVLRQIDRARASLTNNAGDSAERHRDGRR
jgi:heptosyltransferase-2